LVLVLQVVSMLPHVHAEDRGAAFHPGVVLIGGAFDDELAALFNAEPGPAAAEAGGARVGEGFLEGGETAELVLDGFGESAGGLAAALGRHDRPKQRVVGVSGAVVANSRADLLGH